MPHRFDGPTRNVITQGCTYAVVQCSLCKAVSLDARGIDEQRRWYAKDPEPCLEERWDAWLSVLEEQV